MPTSLVFKFYKTHIHIGMLVSQYSYKMSNFLLGSCANSSDNKTDGALAFTSMLYLLDCSYLRTVSYPNVSIMKTYLYNFEPLKLHFYIVKLGFTGVYISFLISAQNIDCGYSLEPPRRGGSNEYPQSML